MRRVRLNDNLKVNDKVFADYDPERIGTLVKLGDEVSEVWWHDDESTQYVSNEHLEKSE